MKKICILTFLTVMTVFSGKANDEFNDGLLENMDIKTFVSTLNNIEGYFFVGTGEERDLSLILSRPDNTDDADVFAAMEWKTLNPTIAQLSNNESGAPILRGGCFGETIVSATETKDGETISHNYVVFVCPLITIVSPEGAIYSYHKVYNQNTRIQFTQSRDYSINSVYRIDNTHPDGIDITEDIDKDGWYNSTENITDDTTFWVAMESNNDEHDSETAKGASDIRVRVKGSDVILEGDNTTSLAGNFKVTDLWGKTLFDGTWPVDDNGTRCLSFYKNNQGVFFLTSAVTNKTYKFIIHSFES